MYHDTLLAQRLGDGKVKALIPPTEQSRYTRAWTQKDRMYKYAARMLEVLRFTQLVIEMSLRRRLNSRGVWRGIVALEAIK